MIELMGNDGQSLWEETLPLPDFIRAVHAPVLYKRGPRSALSSVQGDIGDYTPMALQLLYHPEEQN